MLTADQNNPIGNTTQVIARRSATVNPRVVPERPTMRKPMIRIPAVRPTPAQPIARAIAARMSAAVMNCVEEMTGHVNALGLRRKRNAQKPR